MYFSSWSVGDLCVAMWTEDGVWYRSKILEIDGDRVLVEFIEYGNKDYTTIGELKPKDALDEEEENEVTVVEKEKDHAWKIGDLCVAKWIEDGVWYRSKILGIEGNTVLVEVVEYGASPRTSHRTFQDDIPSSIKSSCRLPGTSCHVVCSSCHWTLLSVFSYCTTIVLPIPSC